jgi:hypothetical protein
MILPSWKSVLLDSYNPKRITCINCKKSGSIIITINSVYLHFWGLPFFPIRKKGLSTCSFCNETLKPKKMPHNLRIEYQNFKDKIKLPLRHYFGLLLLGIFLCWLAIDIRRNNINELNYYNNPKKGDIYQYIIEYGKYSTFKIINIHNDSITISKNTVDINRIHNISKINKKGNYSKTYTRISKDSLKIMYQEEKVFGIIRK